MKTDIGVSSRGALDEYLKSFGDKVEIGDHLAEAMVSAPKDAYKIAPILDAVRKSRQDLIPLALRLTGGRGINKKYHCSAKHSSQDYIRALEELNNAARIDPKSINELSRIAKDTKKIRDEIYELYLSGEDDISDVDDNMCMRCIDDLNLKPSEIIVKKSDVKDTTGNNKKKALLILISLFIGFKILEHLSKR